MPDSPDRPTLDTEYMTPAQAIAALHADNAALRELVREFTDRDTCPYFDRYMQAGNYRNVCIYCGHEGDDHPDTCPVARARALLGGEEREP